MPILRLRLLGLAGAIEAGAGEGGMEEAIIGGGGGGAAGVGLEPIMLLPVL